MSGRGGYHEAARQIQTLGRCGKDIASVHGDET